MSKSMMTDPPATTMGRADVKVESKSNTSLVWLPLEVPTGMYCWWEGKWCERFSITAKGPTCSVGFKLSWANKRSRRGVDKADGCLELGGRE